MRFKNKKILVYGLGKSGLAVIERLIRLKAKIFLLDTNKKVLDKIASSYDLSTEFDISSLDMIIVSPAIAKNDAVLEQAKMSKIKIISELEFGFLLNKKATYISVTGTNGKTTTVNIIYNILKSSGKNSYLLGNVGTPLSSATIKKGIVALEVSSFQLEYIDKFRPQIAIILNLAPDHLNRYTSLSEYYSYKKKIIQNSKNDILILNKDDNNLKNFNPQNTKVYYISLNKFDGKGAFIFDGKICYHDKSTEEICDIKDLKLIGIHNLYNIMASVVACKLMGIYNETIKTAITQFSGLAHRFEFVLENNGVIVINDSKSTNVASTLSAYKSTTSGSHIILGGSSKGECFDALFSEKPKYHFYLYGETAKEIYATAKKYNQQKKCTIFDNLFDATNYALSKAKRGEMVVLSPACASYDAFVSYEDRGEQFKEYVRTYYEK